MHQYTYIFLKNFFILYQQKFFYCYRSAQDILESAHKGLTCFSHSPLTHLPVMFLFCRVMYVKEGSLVPTYMGTALHCRTLTLSKTYTLIPDFCNFSPKTNDQKGIVFLRPEQSPALPAGTGTRQRLCSELGRKPYFQKAAHAKRPNTVKN